MKAKARSKHWEQEAKVGVEKIVGAEKERDEAKEKVQLTRITAVTAGNTKARAEDDLAMVQDALEVAEEARHKAEAKAAHLEVERTSLLLEIGAAKDKVFSLQSQADKDKEAMEEDYQKALELIFSYGYECCMFKHNICVDQPKVPDGMPDSSSNLLPLEFFVNPRCPPTSTASEATTTEVHQSEATKESERSASAGDQS